MFNKFEEQKKRIEQLEKILCPKGHDFQPVDHIPTFTIDFSPNHRDKEVSKIYFEECTRCKKQKRISIKNEVF